MTVCEHCQFHNLEEASVCLRCGHDLEVLAADFHADTVLDLAASRGHSAGFLQLNDIASASSSGNLAETQVEVLLGELHSYLGSEEGRFLSFEVIEDEPEYNEGTLAIATGLGALAEQVKLCLDERDWSKSAWATRLEYALEAEQEIARGTELLNQARPSHDPDQDGDDFDDEEE